MIELRATGVTKRYGATQALAGVSIQLVSGVVTGIAGPNGAGKSTLIRILSGEERQDAGDLVLLRSGQEIRDFKVAVVHQEPQIWPNLTVRKNLAVGRERQGAGRIQSAAEVSEILKLLDIDLFADFELVDLPLAVHQRVEIARAMLQQADVFLFDEPNSALTDEESRSLFDLMAKLAKAGKIIILVTHRLNDFVNACARVLVLKDGRIVAELEGPEGITETAIAARLAVASASASAFPPALSGPREATGSVLLSLRGCSDPGGSFAGVTLEVRSGRVIALAGVEGSGARELAQTVGQFRPNPANRVTACAVAYVAANRRHTVFPNMTICENLTVRLGRQALTGFGGLLSLSKMKQLSKEGIRRYSIKAGDPSDPITSLSGGNQQKVVLGAALDTQADLIVVEEPTRGVDISSKQEIYTLLKSFSRRGKAVVLFCTEVSEMFDVADEVVILSRGAIVDRVSIEAVGSAAELNDLIARAEAKDDPRRCSLGREAGSIERIISA